MSAPKALHSAPHCTEGRNQYLAFFTCLKVSLMPPILPRLSASGARCLLYPLLCFTFLPPWCVLYHSQHAFDVGAAAPGQTQNTPSIVSKQDICHSLCAVLSLSPRTRLATFVFIDHLTRNTHTPSLSKLQTQKATMSAHGGKGVASLAHTQILVALTFHIVLSPL